MFDFGGRMGQYQSYPARVRFIREGAANERCYIVLKGTLAQDKHVGNNGRQIVALHGAHDVCGLSALADDRVKYSFVSLSPVLVFSIERQALLSLMSESQAILQTVLQEISREATIAQTWIANMGQRPAYQRLAYFFCEFVARAQASGPISSEYVEWPGTQADLGAAVGLSLVHVNKTLHRLEADHLVSCKRRVRICDAQELAAVAGFNPGYLARDPETLADMLLSRFDPSLAQRQLDLLDAPSEVARNPFEMVE